MGLSVMSPVCCLLPLDISQFVTVHRNTSLRIFQNPPRKIVHEQHFSILQVGVVLLSSSVYTMVIPSTRNQLARNSSHDIQNQKYNAFFSRSYTHHVLRIIQIFLQLLVALSQLVPALKIIRSSTFSNTY